MQELTSHPPTAAEQAAYATMQARLIALLLQHDQAGFQRYIAQREQVAEHADAPTRPYRDLGVLFFLGNRLFDDILPRIVRRLSFESPRQVVVEEPPARGRIHWERTLEAVWAERPGEAPLALHTRQRRRDFATPENLLTVATLLEYEAAIQRILSGERSLVGAQAMRHPLNDVAARCRRELAFPQFAGLVSQSQRIIDGADGGVRALEARVEANATPGSNRAYQDILHWRADWRNLNLVRRAPDEPTGDTLGADPQRDNYLFQLWIFYELADLLNHAGRLLALDTRAGQMSLRFRWGEGEQCCEYELRHDQHIPAPIVRWEATPRTKDVPGVRPDYYLQRIVPGPHRVMLGQTMVWREPGIVWDAKYYRERESEHTPSSPVKRMLADLVLKGETHGALLFAFLRSAETGTPSDSLASSTGIVPERGRDQTVAPREIRIYQMRPALANDELDPRRQLMNLLDEAHTLLGHPRIPICQGIFLDELSAVQQAGLTDRYGKGLDSSAELLICPKPHIGPWRADLVSRSKHCCRDARFCHIVGQYGARPPVRPARKPEELLQALEQIFASGQSDNLTDEEVSVIAQQVENLTRQFARYNGLEKNLAQYEQRVQDLGLSTAIHLLAAPERESLAIALFLVDQLDSISATDFSAPAIHLSSVMELEIQRRIFRGITLTGIFAHPHNQTLGKLPWMQRDKEQTEGNWERIAEHVAAHWNTKMDPDTPDLEITFELFISKALTRISQLRNRAAHTHPVSREEYRELQRIMLQGGSLGYGALNALLLAWR